MSAGIAGLCFSGLCFMWAPPDAGGEEREGGGGKIWLTQRRKDAKKTAAFIHVVTPVLIGNDEEGSVVLDYIVVTGYIITDEADQLHAIRDQGAAAHARQRGGAERQIGRASGRERGCRSV